MTARPLTTSIALTALVDARAAALAFALHGDSDTVQGANIGSTISKGREPYIPVMQRHSQQKQLRAGLRGPVHRRGSCPAALCPPWEPAPHPQRRALSASLLPRRPAVLLCRRFARRHRPSSGSPARPGDACTGTRFGSRRNKDGSTRCLLNEPVQKVERQRSPRGHLDVRIDGQPAQVVAFRVDPGVQLL